jgi:hypothetical protein
LKVVGSVDLPAMAYTFAALNNIIDGTSGHDNDAFGREGFGDLDQVYPEWSELRDSLQNIFGRTATNIQTAGNVVLHVVEAYAATDEEAKRSLDSIWKQGPPPSLHEGENPPPGEPPAVVLQ